jgi:hypothetical protein
MATVTCPTFKTPQWVAISKIWVKARCMSAAFFLRNVPRGGVLAVTGASVFDLLRAGVDGVDDEMNEVVIWHPVAQVGRKEHGGYRGRC